MITERRAIHRKLIERIVRGVGILKTLQSQTAVHRHLFSYTMDHLQLWADDISKTARDDECTQEEFDALNEIVAIFTTIKSFIVEYSMSVWIEPTLTHSVHLMVLRLKTQFKDMQACAKPFGEEALSVFDIIESEWKALHTLDLQAIHASFSQFIDRGEQDLGIISRMNERLAEIDAYIADNATTENVIGNLCSTIPETYRKWIVKIRHFEKVKQIGFGLSAKVFEGIDKRTGKSVAIKEFNLQSLNGARFQFFQRELAALAMITDMGTTTMVKLIGVTESHPLCIITEFMPNGTLDKHLRNPKVFVDPMFKTTAAYDIARSIRLLHSLNLIHRDLKSLNVLIDENNHAKVCDFGFSRAHLEGDTKALNLGTSHWMAPEIFKGKGSAHFSVDTYAYGIVLCELVCQTKPFDGIPGQMVRKIVLEEGKRPELPFDVNPNLRKLIEQCLETDPEKRPTFEDIVGRFRSLAVLFDGTDPAEFARYMRCNPEVGDEPLLGDARIEKIMTGDSSLPELVEELERDGIPDDKVDILWNAVPHIEQKRDTKREDLARFVALFFDTSKSKEALEFIRKFQRGTVPSAIVEMLLDKIPSDRDMLITVVCCKNGYAAQVALKVTDESCLYTALEVCAKSEIPTEIRTSIKDKCIAILQNSSNDWLRIAALRCILCWKEFAALENINYMSLLRSSNETLQRTCLAVIIGIGLSGQKIDHSVLEMLLVTWQSDPEYEMAIVAACCNEEICSLILSKLASEKLSPGLVKVWLAASKHENMRSVIAEQIKSRGAMDSGICVNEMNVLAQRIGLM